MIRLFSTAMAVVSLAFCAVLVQAAPAHATPPCWTSFNPAAPQGAPMDQTYRNCNGYQVTVMPFYQDLNGSYYIFNQACKTVPDGGVVTWHFNSTVQNVNYGTALCADVLRPNHEYVNYVFPTQPHPPCWTSFLNQAPNGGPNSQFYTDCSYSAVSVAPAYTTSGGLSGYAGDCLQSQYMADKLAVFEWDWDYATVPNVNDTTVFCVGQV